MKKRIKGNVNTRSKPRKRKESFVWKYRFRILALVILMSVFGFLWLYSANKQIQIRYKISSLKQQEKRLKMLNRKLELEISVLKSPQRLESIAKRLGLKKARPDQIIRVR